MYGSRWSRRFFNIWEWLPTALAFLVVYGMLIGFFSRRWPLDLIFSLTTTSGGDTGAHHYPAQYLIQELLPNWRLTGWAPGWYAGMPMLTFYFPLPFLVIALLDYILPYTVAFKIGTVLGVFLLPLTIYGMGRLLRIRKPFPVIAAVFAGGFLLMEKSGAGQLYSIYGGNILSTLAGEFGYMLSFALVFLFLGSMYRGMEKPRLRMLFVANCVLLMALALSHIVTTIILVLVVPGLLLPHILSSRQEGERLGLSEMGLLAAIAGFALCFMAYLRSSIWFMGVGGMVLLAGLIVALWWPIIKRRSSTAERAVGYLLALEIIGFLLVAVGVVGYVRSDLLVLGVAVLGLLVLLVGLLVVLVWPIIRHRSSASRRALGYLLAVGVVGFCLVAFWSLPFAANLGWTADMKWDQLPLLGKPINVAAQWALVIIAAIGLGSAMGLGVYAAASQKRVFPIVGGILGATLTICALICIPFLSGYLLPGTFIPLFVLGIVGMAFAVARRETRMLPLAWLTAVAFLMYALMPDGKMLWNGRLLSFWYVSFYIWSAYGVTWLIRSFMVLSWDLLRVRTRFTQKAYAPFVAIVVVAIVAASSSVAGGWIRWNYQGYEQKPAWPEYKQILDYIDTFPQNSRVMIEHGDKLDQFGTPRAFEIIPYWTQAATMEGTLMEASYTAAFHFINQRELSEQPSNAIIGVLYPSDIDVTRGITHLQMMNIPYFLAFVNDENERVIPAVDADPRAELLTTFGDYRIYHIKDCSGYVEIMKNEPVRVSVEQDAWRDMAVEWYKNASVLDIPLVWDNGEEALKQFPQVSAEAAVNPPRVPNRTVGVVSNIDLQNESLSFDTTAIGEPHWIKISYFPNWHVEGAEGPFLASPSMMMVIPTQEHVVLTYGGTWANTVGQSLQGLAWALLLGLTIWRVVARVKRRPEPAPEGPVAAVVVMPPALPERTATAADVQSDALDEEGVADYWSAGHEAYGEQYIPDFEEDPPVR